MIMRRTALLLLLPAAALLAFCLASGGGGKSPDPPDPRSCADVVCPPIEGASAGCDEGECVYLYGEPGYAPPPG
jgi:hypothetical protein